LVATLAACGGTTDSGDSGGSDSGGGGTGTTTDGSGGTVLYNDANKTLIEGESTSGYNLTAGSYVAEVTSSGAGGGVKVQWTGASCPSAAQTKYYHNLCVIPAAGGALVVSNPDTEYKGNETVHVVLRNSAPALTPQKFRG